MESPRSALKSGSEEPILRLAVLIDVDNAQAACIDGLLAGIARFGEATVKANLRQPQPPAERLLE